MFGFIPKMDRSNMRLYNLAFIPFAAFFALSVSAAPFAYVSNERAGVSVIDLDQMAVVREIDVAGQGPRGISVTAEGAFVVTANKGTSDISVMDAQSGKLVKRVNVGKNVEFVRIVGDLAYITYEPSGPGAPVEAGKPEEPAAKPAKAGNKAEKEDDDDLVPAEIAVVDIKQGKVIASMKSGRETEGIEFSADGKFMLVANEGENTVTVYDRQLGKILQKIDVSSQGSRPRGIKISPDGKTYAVTLEFSDKVILIGSNYKMIKSAATKKSPYGVSFDPEGKRLFVAASRSSVIQVFDVNTLALLGEIPVGQRCWHFSFSSDGKKLIVACGKSDSLVIADTTTYAVLKTLTGFKGPWGVVTYPRARGSIDTP
jgi:YVTN family beta-propeller protein